MNKIRTFGVVVLTALLVSLNTTEATAASAIWQKGVKLSEVPHFALMDDAWPIDGAMYGEDAKGCHSGATVSSAVVKRVGDYIYVKDTCGDGRSAIARMKAMNDDSISPRICRNSSGQGTWVRCNFNWPESTDYCFAAGVYDGDTGFFRLDHWIGAELCGPLS